MRAFLLVLATAAITVPATYFVTIAIVIMALIDPEHCSQYLDDSGNPNANSPRVFEAIECFEMGPSYDRWLTKKGGG